MTPAQADPRGLIREAYRIDGIGGADCRAIFLDWALGLPEGADMQAAARLLLTEHGAGAPEHPMTHVLRAGLAAPEPPRRRGGFRRRR